MITPEKFARKAFYVEAVVVTDENMEEVAKWCGGEVKTGKDRDQQDARYIQVNVARAIHPNQTKAFVGNRVLRSGANFKVYTEKAFQATFETIPEGQTVTV